MLSGAAAICSAATRGASAAEGTPSVEKQPTESSADRTETSARAFMKPVRPLAEALDKPFTAASSSHGTTANPLPQDHIVDQLERAAAARSESSTGSFGFPARWTTCAYTASRGKPCRLHRNRSDDFRIRPPLQSLTDPRFGLSVEHRDSNTPRSALLA